LPTNAQAAGRRNMAIIATNKIFCILPTKSGSEAVGFVVGRFFVVLVSFWEIIYGAINNKWEFSTWRQ
jgi:hypothetical protein